MSCLGSIELHFSHDLIFSIVVFFQNRRTRTTNTRCLMTITGNVTRSLRSRSRQLEKTSCDRLKEYLSWPFVNVATVVSYLNFSLFLYYLLCAINICKVYKQNLSTSYLSVQNTRAKYPS